ncbi:hypothetical protein HNY73_009710 [Argiope bruennichi]|uniref:Uncharacterized protein n=1 Tax=Argiope bruennichi TaxID=94029 RepID=A0A8T0FFG8_ARGBR|nr:hypothetical protein HNY73_009710 [Argiope bruennichi]
MCITYHSQNNPIKNTITQQVVTGSNGVDEQKQRKSGVSDFIQSGEDCKTILEKCKWKSLENSKHIFLDSVESVVRNSRSNNNISGTVNLIVNPNLNLGSTELRNGMIHVSGNVMDENISLQMLSQIHRKNLKILTNVKVPFSSKYSLQQPVQSDENHDKIKDKCSENSNNEQLRTPSDSSYFNPISDVQGIEVQTNENASFTASLENVESSYRPETDQHETDEKMIVAAGLNGDSVQKQNVSDLSDLILVTMSLEDSKWKSLNNDKNIFIDSLECVVKKLQSHNSNISGTENFTVIHELPPGRKEPKNVKRQESEMINDEHSSLD